MNLPYTMRLFCLCCASFFMIHLALALVTRLSAGTALRVAEHMKPSSAARFLFVLRLAPLVLTLFAVLAFCIPSYLWLEPEATGEKVGFFCVFTAVMGVAIWALSERCEPWEPCGEPIDICTSASVTAGRSM